MKIEVREQPLRAVYFWISKKEAADEELMQSIKAQFPMWNEKKYRPVIMESGVGSLEDSTYCLLKHNMELLAKKTSC